MCSARFRKQRLLANSSRFAAQFAGHFRRTVRDRVNRYGGFQIAEKCPASGTPFLGVGPIDAVDQFSNGDGGQRNFAFTDTLNYLLEELSNVKMLTFGIDDHAGVED
jgi:hypothetical protein